MPDPADHAYGHACAVLGTGPPAAAAAIAGVRSGGRSRWAVLGNTRHAALERATGAEGPDLDAVAPDDLVELAVALAATRPPLERAVVDLATRHDLDRGGFSRALGLSPAGADALADEVFSAWQQLLDPVVVARLGAAGCEGLAAVLGEAGPGAVGARAHDSTTAAGGATPPDPRAAPAPEASLRALLDLGPAVADHAAGCDGCGDRLRAMVSVRTLVGRRPLDPAPPEVRAVAAPSRFRRPVMPPPLTPEGRVHRWVRPAATATAAIVFAVAGGVGVAARRDEAPERSLAALTEVPPGGGALQVRPAAVTGPLPPPVRLENRSGRELSWTAATDAGWLSVEPGRGALEAGSAMPVRLAVGADAPEGEARGTVRFTGDDGSVTVVRLVAVVEHPPDLAASIDGCTVTATVEDEGEVRSVELHRVERAESGRDGGGTTNMEPGEDRWVGHLPRSAAAQVWWVTAVDARGNTSRTPDQTLPADGCP